MSSLGLSIAGRLAQLPGPARRPPAPRASLDALIAARQSAHGPLHLLEQPAAAAPVVDPESLRALALSEAPLDTTRLLYFDTETTGLAGGTGTLAFLLGVAEVEGSGVRLSQVHLPGPGQERPMLEWLREKLEASTLLISFNGRSFDWPLLRSRFVMNRLPPPPQRPHVDLLHCARRVFRHQLDEVRLTTLERRVLDVRRVGDIDGALIPAAWFDYLRTGRVAVLGRVLEHNLRDVQSMVALVERLCAAWEERHPVLPATALGLASVAARHGDEARALRFVAQAAGEGSTAEQAFALEAELRRRRGEYRESVEALLRAVLASRAPAPLHLKLTKLYEHRLRDYEAARRHAALCGPAEAAPVHSARQARLAGRR